MEGRKKGGSVRKLRVCSCKGCTRVCIYTYEMGGRVMSDMQKYRDELVYYE